jgi:RNA polymerase sigma factor (sigma-70 family)
VATVSAQAHYWHVMGTSSPPFDFQAVHERFRPQVLRYLMRLAGECEAEDLTQSVMLKVSTSLADFRGESSLSTWIYRIAFRGDRRRPRLARGHREDSPPSWAAVPEEERKVVAREVADKIIARLKQDHELTLHL